MPDSSPFSVLIAHNRYRSQSPSGENIVVEREQELLRAAHIPFHVWTRQSDQLASASTWAKIRAGWNLHASHSHVAALAREMANLPGGILHAHNVWPLFTYGLFEAARERGIPTIQTVHNSRLITTNTHLVVDGHIRRPETTDERLFLQRSTALHGNRITNWFYTRALRHYWERHIPQTCVDAYICLTDFQRRGLIAAGIPAERTVVKPNFLDHRGPVGDGPGGYALFVGRLSAEKGILPLAQAWKNCSIPLHVIGDGPLRSALEELPHVRLLGRQPPETVAESMAQARFLVMNSTCYEGFPLVLIEALAAGTPCLVPNLGGLPDIITNGILGRTFTPNDAQDLENSARALWDEAPMLRSVCRQTYLNHYTPERNRIQLLNIYNNILHHRRPDNTDTQAKHTIP